jgi:hypothetical protein
MKPREYRETPFVLPDETVFFVAALAHPRLGGQNPLDVFRYLQEKDVSVIFGLEAAPNFSTLANQVGIEYLDVSIPDFTAPSFESV